MPFLALKIGLEVAFQNDLSVLKCLFNQWSLNRFLALTAKKDITV